MLKLTGGQWRGRALETPKDQQVRPTTVMAREALFNILQQEVVGCRWLELYAGSGIMALEALSRGAHSAVLMERAPAALALIQRNIDKVGAENQCYLLRGEADRASSFSILQKKLEKRFPEGWRADMIFMDPPYGKGLVSITLERLAQWEALQGHTPLIVAEHEPEAEIAWQGSPWHIVQQRRYGQSVLTFLGGPS
ncbi:putative methyltransferase [Magnetococcus marinus MC-1]|uniref:Putative methyltransferase n=1 Tax=Magnetococcus marinus (strain ATCC BAA-1437 / JCM 17883 / MC-1) TaxID=156889 RepID=A0L7K1_MAGMM|nr:16S rRNA (guanine(966)-N(2))-methyltransferase RsmD [Magnetococcus marinus]ABK43944.1 putative methyltransferase [Magnetococcus marinus MC-1]